MSFFRSERMYLYSIVLHQDTAFDCMVEMGYAGKAQLINVFDGHVHPNMKYVNEVQRCTELERIIKRLQEEINRMGMRAYYYPNVDIEEIPREKDLQTIETILFSLERELIEVMRHCDTLQNRKLSMTEHRQVLLKTEDFLTGARNTEAQITSYDSMIFDLIRDTTTERQSVRGDRPGPLNFITGSMSVTRFAAFEVMVWRISRGNAYVKFAEFEIPAELAKRHGQNRYKKAFIIVFVGQELKTKLLKVCQGFQAKIYPCPETHKERAEILKTLATDIDDFDEIFAKSCEHKKRILGAATTDLYIWRAKVRKMHDVYFVLNRLGKVRELKKTHEKYLQADVWIPKHSVKKLRAALMRGARRAAENDPTQMFPPIITERTVPEKVKPPTFFRTNKFTGGFQNLINAYGVAAYRELNPAPYTIVTFPFLFAIMFGDAGHGLLVCLFALMLIRREKSIEREQKEATKVNEIFDLLYGGRYILLLMGIFSIYAGFIYNDLFSKTMNIFGSSWRVNYTINDVIEHKHLQLDPARPDNFLGVPYIMGIDPIWNLAENNIIVGNSLKMKMAIILGVFQMLFGLGLSAWNALYNSSKIDFYLVFLPQLIFFMSLFFYLVFLIFFKWYMYGGHLALTQSSGCAPSILITFINMVLLKSAEKVPEGCNLYMYDSQPTVQHVLLFIAILSIPVLLCGKPIHFMLQHKRIKNIKDPDRKDRVRRETMEGMRKSLIYSVDSLALLKIEEPEEQLSEIWIHSGIHTIECVLGSVSHTASYLRLWALSLAHAQLSHVLWKMVLSIGFTSNRGYADAIIIYFAFACFAALTVAILVVMEGLSAFLHTLRLHWVEFQSKFYSGTGEAFAPFRFRRSTKLDTVTSS